MAFDYSKLRGRIIEKFGSLSAFAIAVGKPLNTISRKLNGSIAISMQDICEWSKEDVLDIPADQYHEYFFTLKVQEVEL